MTDITQNGFDLAIGWTWSYSRSLALEFEHSVRLGLLFAPEFERLRLVIWIALETSGDVDMLQKILSGMRSSVEWEKRNVIEVEFTRAVRALTAEYDNSNKND